jgi:hypothetical protein
MAWSNPRTWITGEVVTAAHMNQEVRDNLNAVLPDGVTNADWDPTLEATTTNPIVDLVDGAEYQVGALQFGWVRWVVLDVMPESLGSGTYVITLPVASAGIVASSNNGTAIGTWRIVDSGGSAANSEVGSLILASSTIARFGRHNAAGLTAAALSAFTQPILTCQFVYPFG